MPPSRWTLSICRFPLPSGNRKDAESLLYGYARRRSALHAQAFGIGGGLRTDGRNLRGAFEIHRFYGTDVYQGSVSRRKRQGFKNAQQEKLPIHT